MTEQTRTELLTEATAERAAARRIFDRAAEDVAQNPGARWAMRELVQAEEEFNFWDSKVANLSQTPRT